jgi:hypothetical protein
MLRALGNIDQLYAAFKTIVCLMQRPKQTVEEAYCFLVVIVIHCYAFRYDVNCDYILRRQAKKRKTEDVDLSLWHTPALSGSHPNSQM